MRIRSSLLSWRDFLSLERFRSSGKRARGERRVWHGFRRFIPFGGAVSLAFAGSERAQGTEQPEFARDEAAAQDLMRFDSNREVLTGSFRSLGLLIQFVSIRRDINGFRGSTAGRRA